MGWGSTTYLGVQSRVQVAKCLPQTPAQPSPSEVLTWHQRGGWWKADHRRGWYFHKGCWERQDWGAEPSRSPPARALGAASREGVVSKSLTVQCSPAPPPSLMIHLTTSFTVTTGAHLGLVADDYIILHGKRHVAHMELHPATFQHAGKACPRPRSWVLCGGLTFHH